MSAHCPLIGALLSPHKHLNRSSVSLTQLVLGMELQSMCVLQSLAFAANRDKNGFYLFGNFPSTSISMHSLNEF